MWHGSQIRIWIFNNVDIVLYSIVKLKHCFILVWMAVLSAILHMHFKFLILSHKANRGETAKSE